MSTPASVLVTGGTGFVGKPLVRRLVAEGRHVRVLTRTPAKIELIEALGAEAFVGDVTDIDSFGRAMDGCNQIVHLAAGTSGSDPDAGATVDGTRNLLNLCRRLRQGRLVYVSSCSVYGVADYEAGAVVTETSGVERFPERRGTYSASKQEAETYVSAFAAAGTVPTVILRPGMIYGFGGELYTPLVGLAAGSTYMVIGNGNGLLPLVYIDDLVDAICLSMDKDEAVGQVFNVVDPEPIDKRTYMDQVIRRVDPGARVVYVPYALLYGVTWLQERAFGLLRQRPLLTCYRLTSSQRRVRFDSSRIRARLGWQPRVSVEKAAGRILDSMAMAGDGAAPAMRPPAANQARSLDSQRRAAGSQSAR